MSYTPQACVEVLDVEEGVDFGLPHADTVLLAKPLPVKTAKAPHIIRLWILRRPGAA